MHNYDETLYIQKVSKRGVVGIWSVKVYIHVLLIDEPSCTSRVLAIYVDCVASDECVRTYGLTIAFSIPPPL